MQEHDDKTMVQELEILNLSKDMQHLTESFASLKDTLEKNNTEIHNHINRKFSDEMTIGLLTLKNEMRAYTDDKVSGAVSDLKIVIKTWASLVVVVVALTVGTITYINTSHIKNDSSPAADMTELFKVMMQENRKNVKQTQVIIEPERIIP